MRREHYLGGALTDEESKEFVAKYNKLSNRKCIAITKKTIIKDYVVFLNQETVCGKVFMSTGAHNRKCPACKSKEAYQIEKTNSRDIPTHKYSAAFKRMNAFRGEID